MNRRTPGKARPLSKIAKKNKNSGLQPEEKRQPSTLPVGRSAEADLRLYTPVFPVSTRKKLVYYEPALSIAATAGVLTTYVYSANGAYDPDITSGGHSPIGWDQMMIFYEQATVLSSKITVNACGNGAQACNVAVSISPDTSAPASTTVLMENGFIARTIVDGRGGGSYGTGTRIKSVSLDNDAAKYFGRPSPREMVNDTTLSCNSGANPTEQVYYLLNTWGFGSFSDNTSVSADVVIEYDCIFWEPRKAPISAPTATPLVANKNDTRANGPVRALACDPPRRQ